MPDAITPRTLQFWRTRVRSRLGGANVDLDVIEEIAQHAEELYRSSRAEGQNDEESLAAVETELADGPALIRAARAARRRRGVPRPPEPAAGRFRHLAAFLTHRNGCAVARRQFAHPRCFLPPAELYCHVAIQRCG